MKRNFTQSSLKHEINEILEMLKHKIASYYENNKLDFNDADYLVDLLDDVENLLEKL